MKRLTILSIMAGLVVLCLVRNSIMNRDMVQRREVSNGVCFGQYRSETLRRGNPRVSARKVVQLTEPNLKGPISFEEALSRRRSVRQFTSQRLKRAQIGQLAWAGQGITEPQRGLRTAPSAGAPYPIELYFATEEGLFIYRPQQHSLEQILEQDVRRGLSAAASAQEAVAGAPCNIIVAGSSRKLANQFRDKARTYMLLEAGHIAQNIQLQAVCLDLGSATIGGFDTRGVSRICRLARGLEPVYIICVGYPAAEGTTGTGQGIAGAKRAVLIASSQNFRDEELFETRRVLNAAGVQTVIASTRLGIIRGMLGNAAEANILVNQIRVDDYDAIIFIGGAGAVFEYFGNPVVLNIAREAAAKRKVLAAISIAPSVLANAGVLMGVRATAFLSERNRLVQAGAIYTGVPVEIDRSIITASSPAAVVLFGQAIAEVLAGR